MTQNQGSISIGSSLLARAIENDSKSIETMCRQFLPDDEKIHYIQYLGLKGIWGIGTHEFVCLTDRRVADITVGRFGEVIYQDGYLECINSTVIHQPSKLGLYLAIASYITVCVIFYLPIIVTFPLAIFPIAIIQLFFVFLVFQLYYRFVKCGVVLMIKEGIPVYMFANRKYISRVNTLCRQLTIAREDRIKAIKKMH
jgi:hypothetical protein